MTSAVAFRVGPAHLQRRGGLKFPPVSLRFGALDASWFSVGGPKSVSAGDLVGR